MARVERPSERINQERQGKDAQTPCHQPALDAPAAWILSLRICHCNQLIPIGDSHRDAIIAKLMWGQVPRFGMAWLCEFAAIWPAIIRPDLRQQSTVVRHAALAV
jgi:hypothetical protein